MDIFTDASLNDRKKVAGIGAVFVPSKLDMAIRCYNSYCFVNKIETAELLAIAMALSLLNPEADKSIRVISDSKGALRKIQSIFHHSNQNHIHTIRDSLQKKILYNISSSFSKILNMKFSFCCIHGHQHKIQEASDGYYNSVADQEALKGRMNGETILQQEGIYPSGISVVSAEERIILNQQECNITVPQQISFHYDESKRKMSVHRHSKSPFVRTVCKSAHHTR